MMQFAESQSFNQLKQKVLDIVQTGLPNLPRNAQIEMKMTNVLDEVGWNFFPKDGLRNVFPVVTYGDGNCFPQCVSRLVFGTERRHLEI